MSLLKNSPLVVLVLALVACDQGLEARVSKLEAEALSEKVARLESQMTDVRGDVIQIKFKVDAFESTSFDPAASRGYGRVDTTSGIFLVSLENVQPYLDGVRVALEIGNIQNATYTGFTIDAKYGRRFPKFIKEQTAEDRKRAFSLYEQSQREKTTKFTETLRPATWNRVSLTLPEISPADFGFLQIKLRTDTVQLASTRNR